MPVLIRSRLRQPAPRPRSIKALAQSVLTAAGEADSELSLEFVGDGRMRRLNREYGRRDATTDVLAFSMRDAHSPAASVLGDVVISLPAAARQAAAQGHGLEREVATLLVHGVLHLCGYDHERSAREADRMFRKQRAILRKLGQIPRLFIYRDASRVTRTCDAMA